MLYWLSFGAIRKLSDDIAEVIVDNDVVMTLEMVEEYESFLQSHFPRPFGLLINRINNYSYTYEAQLSIGSLENIKALAVVNYHPSAQLSTQRIATIRTLDNWNIKQFSGLMLGYQKAKTWLEHQLQLAH